MRNLILATTLLFSVSNRVRAGNDPIGQQLLLSAEQSVLDLRNVPATERRSPGVPGSSVTGIVGGAADSGSPSQSYRLPLRLRVHKLIVHKNRTKLTIELDIFNTGTTRVSIPSCLDGQKVHAAGTLDRRTLWLGLIFQSAKQEIDQPMDGLFGSSSIPNCSIPLDPGKSLRVVDDIQVPREVLTTKGDISARAYLQEYKIENRQYTIQVRSQRVESESLKLWQSAN